MGYSSYTPNKVIPWEVNNMHFSDQWVAGFLDGDGSFVATGEHRPERRRFPYKINLRITFTQHERHRKVIEALWKHLGNRGNIREVKSHKLVELVIQDRQELRHVLGRLKYHIIIKRKQAELMERIIAIYDTAIVNVRASLAEKEYAQIINLVNEIRRLNSNTGGKNLKLFNPVTTQRNDSGVARKKK